MGARRVAWLVAMVAVLVGLGAMGTPRVEAQGVWFYRWELEFPFQNRLDGRLTLFLKPPGQPVQTLRRQATCATKGAGTVTLDAAAGLATFANGGYLECEFPDLPDMVETLSGGQLSLPSPAAYEQFWMQATAELDTSISVVPWGNPIFSHPSIEYFAPYDAATPATFLRARVPGQTVSSTPFSLPAGPTGLFVGHFAQNANCQARFRVAGALVSSQPFGCPAFDRSVLFDVTPTTFYVGHSPAQGTFFFGDLHSLLVDPPTWGVVD